MKNLLITIALLLSMTMNAQEKPTYKVVGKEIVKIDRVNQVAKKEAIKTDLTYKIKDTVYQVYQTSKGGYYINRVSKKSGKSYRMYLPTK